MFSCWLKSTVSCDNPFLKYIIKNKWATSLTYTSRNKIQLYKSLNMTYCVYMALCIYTAISFIYMISRVYTYFLTLPYIFLNFSYILYDVTPYGYNAINLILYGLLIPCTTQCRILFHSTILLNLLVRMFVLYLLHGCLISSTLLWYLYDSRFHGTNIHIIFLLISLSFIVFYLF